MSTETGADLDRRVPPTPDPPREPHGRTASGRASAPLSLLTFAPMIDSELSRFVLWHYRVPYHEEPHIFGWSSVLALLHGGTGRIPLLYGSGLRLTSPRDIVDHYDATTPDDRKLVPAAEPLRSAVEADWALYNGQLALWTAAVAYYHLLPRRDIMIEPFSRGVPPGEAQVGAALYPLLRALFGVLLQLGPARAAEGITRIRMIVDRTDERIADGRSFLVGDRLTLADLALATATAPLLLPPGYEAPIPPLAWMPPALQAIVGELRQRPTARFVERIYELRTT